MKKKGVLWGVLLSLFGLIPLVSALDLRWSFQRVIGSMEEMLTPFFEVLLRTNSGEFFFAKILLLLLLFIVLITVLKKVPLFENNYMLSFIVAAIISILSMRYLPSEDFFQAMLLPYSTIGIAITVFLPFLIYFYFVHTSGSGTFGRRAAWFLFGAVFLVLWVLRRTELGNADWIYIMGIGFVVLSFVFDKSIHRYFGLHEIGISKSRMADTQRVKMLADYQDALDVYNRTKDRAAERRVKHLAKQLGVHAGEDA